MKPSTCRDTAISRHEVLLGRRLVVLTALSAAALGSSSCSTPRPTSPAAGVDASPARTSSPVELEVDGTPLRPRVELAEDSPAQISWVDLDTGSSLGSGGAPTLSTEGVRRVGMHVMSGDAPAFDDVRSLNLGFNRDDDYGRLSLTSSYQHDSQPVTAVAGLAVLRGLVRFCAAGTPLSGRLDLSGLSALEHVECYGSAIESLDLSGCTSLVRLCVESCRLTELDLEPVRVTLQDLRAAIQRSDGLSFVRLDGPMEALYHYCVREQPVHHSIPHAQLPVVEEYWVWGSGQRTCDAPTSPRLTSFLARDNAYDQESVDTVLRALHRLVPDDEGRVDLSGETADGDPAAAPSSEGEVSAAALLAAGWRVSTN